MSARRRTISHAKRAGSRRSSSSGVDRAVYDATLAEARSICEAEHAKVVAAGGLVLATIGIGPVWEPTTNLMAIIDGEVTYYVNVPPTCGGNMLAQGGACDPERTLSLQHGVGYYGVALALVAGASVVSFRRRDVP